MIVNYNQLCGYNYYTCSTCAIFTQSCFTQSYINIPVGLTSATGSSVYILISDKFQQFYQDLTTVNNDGSVDININNFPDGIFYKYSGQTQMYLTSDYSASDFITFNIYGITTSCVNIKPI